MSQPSPIPIVPLQPAPTPQTTPAEADLNPNAAGAGPSVPSSINLQDPKSVEAVTKIVKEVLWKLGYYEATLVSKGRKRRTPNTKRSQQTAIKVQQALISAEEDCWWKVRSQLAD